MTQAVPHGQRLSRNVIASAVDTLCSELMQTDPRALFVSAGGSWDTQNKAKRLTSYADDMCDFLEVDDLREQFVKDGIISGMGIMRPYVSRSEVLAERIFPTNFLLDDRTCVDSTPRTCYVRRYVDRDVLVAKYPKQGAELEMASLPDHNDWIIDSNSEIERTFDVLEVFECWHLPSYEGAKDGQHIVCVDGIMLSRQSYDRPRFPFAFFRPLKPSRGYWGESMVRRAASAQLELNKQLRRLQHIHHMTANGPIIFMQSVNGVPASHITNDVGTIVTTPTGQPPSVVQLPGATPEMYAQLDRLQNYIYEEFAVNEMAAQGTKPSGLSSGKALRLYTDTTSRRFLNVKRSAERSHVSFCRELVACERSLSKQCPEREIMYERYGSKMRVPWSEIDIDDKFLRIKAFPTSSLPTEPAARIETLEEMRKDGALSQEQFWQLMPGADFDQVRDDFVAPTELLKMVLGRILEDGEYGAPEPYMNLPLGMELAGRLVQRGEIDGAPEDRLEMLRQWITDAKRSLERLEQAQAAAQGPPPPPMGPEGMPMPPEMMPPPGAPMDPMMAPPGEPMPMDLPPELMVPAAE